MSTQIIEIRPIDFIKEQVGDPRRWFALPILDFNVVNLALPAIRDYLGATSSVVQFVISAYAATYAVFLITGGRLGDLFGRRSGRCSSDSQTRQCFRLSSRCRVHL